MRRGGNGDVDFGHCQGWVGGSVCGLVAILCVFFCKVGGPSLSLSMSAVSGKSLND